MKTKCSSNKSIKVFKEFKKSERKRLRVEVGKQTKAEIQMERGPRMRKENLWERATATKQAW